jgi:L-ascorbate metabolism protein UlaG (beta-lactamase superfamily)
MRITYFGHAFFLLEGENGPAIAIDPFDASIGYSVPSVTADLVLASHEHFDHANVGAVQGKPRAIVGAAGVGRHELGGAAITGVAARHYGDPALAARGDNTVYLIELDGLRVCHTGDLGHALDDPALAQLGRVDILMVPVGGFFTLDVERVDDVVNRVAPKVVIPMHYRTPAVTSDVVFRIATKDAYLRGKKNVREQPSTIAVRPEDLPAQREIWVMAYVE